MSAMFAGACGPPEKLSLVLMQRSCVLRMTAKLAYLHCQSIHTVRHLTCELALHVLGCVA